MALGSDATVNPQRQDLDFEKDFPFFLDITYDIGRKSTMLHWHNCIEICYIKQGTGIYLIDGKMHPFCEGDFFIISSRQLHLAYDVKDVVIQVLIFDPEFLWNGGGCAFEIEYLKPFWDMGKNFSSKLDKTSKYHESINRLLLEIEEEYKARELGYKQMIKSLLLQLAAILVRHFDIRDHGNLLGKMGNYRRLQHMLSYIDGNYFRQIKLKDLAMTANMSVSNFSAVFKDTIGSTPIEYLTMVRIVKASGILLESNMKILDVAANCGFSSVSHFVKSFKKYTGKVPREFRKSN